jgi:hypothetical protein
LFNPIDGNSYLAKMFQGWRGDWRFTLPYTADPGRGAFLFLFYLALGHLTRLIGAPLVLIFHAARLVSILVMLVALQRFLGAVLPEQRSRDTALLLAVLGSGLGWVALPFNSFTSDFWVAEAYPFLSAYANPHFPLGTALLLLILMPDLVETTGSAHDFKDLLHHHWPRLGFLMLVSLALSAIAPFGVVIALIVLGAVWVWALLERRTGSEPARRIEWFAGGRFVTVALGGLPLLAYSVWITYTHPVLRIWNEQNQTPAPPFWDLLVSFSPLILLAVLGGWRLLKERGWREIAGEGGVEATQVYPDTSGWTGWRIPLVWAALTLVLIYIPLNVQRRFLMGYTIPLAALAPPALVWLARGRRRNYRVLLAFVVLLMLPTNLLILLSGQQAAQVYDPAVYVYRSEIQAFDWLQREVPPGSLVLSSPQTGLLIPAYTGLNVLYGHPFETAHATEQRQAVTDFFSAGIDAIPQAAFLEEHGIDYVFYGPRERALGGVQMDDRLDLVYQDGSTVIYILRQGGLGP